MIRLLVILKTGKRKRLSAHGATLREAIGLAKTAYGGHNIAELRVIGHPNSALLGLKALVVD